MLKPSQIGLISAMCLFSSVAMAKGERYGLSTSMLTIDSIKYDEGKSGEQDTLRFGLVHTRPIDENNNRWRWWLGLNYLAEDIEAPANGLYQEATNYELRVVPQYALTSWSVFTPYVGAGLSVGYSQYSNRWQVDQEGYRYESVEDIDQFELGAVMTLGTAIKLGSNPDAHIQIIPQASYILPVVNDGIGGLELSVSLLF
ncbi:hypothetical protein K08M3_43630 [Vibrio alginolyticus]|jgi:opacity protein-like surface antigen|uniref:Outer membrane protein beta-barrel domain-containing protein n=1 Tax=Vibrio alginolyticus TaxID=663 RepID=A0A1W6TK27_VIBAL|nr:MULTISPECIES: hypothetical protein [Vibrio]MDW1808800.1 hypothetical protein [Vibrio sp. Vb2362]NAW96379.1 hypothetical protein [Vibrio sp. V42_P2S4T144]QCO88256.1 hypothetical protein D3H41_19790 [Vibrio neocaledonicus]ARP01202.1 hypothetical protein K01M1_43780 [Vibrio alginolyticus]ARP05908.1 hypothetical protein K04M1_43770 [Vibrio alginolyticus]